MLMGGIGVSNGGAFGYEGYSPALWAVVNDLRFSPSGTIWTMGARFQISDVHMVLRNKGVDVHGASSRRFRGMLFFWSWLWYVSGDR